MQNYWKDKNILITGATGFLGKHLSEYLEMAHAKVVKLSSNESLRKSGYEIGNITNLEDITKIMKEKKIEVCFHLAAQPLVDIGGSDPLPTFNINIKGTWNILEAARVNNLEGTILASTSHVYGNSQLPFIEKYFPRPSRPYETSKACADMLAQTYASYYRVPIAIARFVNIYGPGDSNERLIPRTIRRLLDNQPPEIYQSQTTRDYMYISDAVGALVLLAQKTTSLQKLKENIVFNFGTGKHYTNAEIVKKILDIFNKEFKEDFIVDKDRPQEITKQYVSIKKATELLHWEPKISLDEGLNRTVEYYI